MNVRSCCVLFIITIIMMSSFAPIPTEAKKVIFYSTKQKILHSQLLSMEARSAPCPKGQIRDHRKKCRRALTFSRSK